MKISSVLACAVFLQVTHLGVAQVPEPLAQKWDVRFAATPTGRDIPIAIATDAAGDIYVAAIVATTFGGRGTVLKFASSNGALLWRWESSAIIAGDDLTGLTPAYARLAIAPDGSPIALFEVAAELVKLRSADGSVAWAAKTAAGTTYPQPRNLVYELAIDPSGDVLAVGSGTEASAGKFRGSDGQLLWTYEPAGAATSFVRSVHATGAGDIIVTGAVRLGSTGAPEQTFTAKLSGATGVPHWLRVEPGTATSNPGGRLVQLDSTGDVIVATYSSRLLKYKGTDGAPVWERALTSMPVDLLTDEAGYIYTAAGGRHTKFEAASGAVVWTADASPAATILLRGDELISLGSAGSTLTAFAKHNGQHLWSQSTNWRHNGPAFSKAVTLIALRPDGNLAITAPTGGGGGFDVAAAFYGPGPSVSGQWINWTLPTKAQVRVNAAGNGRVGTLQCEYGTTTAYGQITPPQAITSTVVQPGPAYLVMLEGLQNETHYHARFIATTDRGTTTTADFTFTTSWDANKDTLPDEWEFLHWANMYYRSATSDEDRDGLTSLMEYALGTNPRRHDSAGALPITIDADERLSVTLPKRPYVTLGAEVSSDLKNWSDGEVREDETTITLRDVVPKGSAPARFLRVRATSP